MTKKILSVVLTLLLMAGLVTSALAIDGPGNGTVKAPQETEPMPASAGTCTRGEWIAKLVDALGLNITEDEYPDNYYTDVADDENYASIMTAVKFGLIDVEAGDAFEPEGPLTREFAAHTANFYLGFIPESEAYSFSDSTETEYPADAQIAVTRGWFELSGDKFLPQAQVTDSEIEKILADAKGVLEGVQAGESKSSYTFAEGVKEIGDKAFYNCSKLSKVTIPISVLRIGVNTFDECLALGEIKYHGTRDDWANISGSSNIPANAHVTYVTKYTISYDANGGSGTMPDSQVFDGAALTLPDCSFTAPVGKRFKAWSINGQEYDVASVYTVTSDTTVKAVWENISSAPSQEEIHIDVMLSYARKNTSTSLKVGDTADLFMNGEDGIITSWRITDSTGTIIASKSYSMWVGSRVTSKTALGAWSPTDVGTYTVTYTISGYSQRMVQVNGSWQYVYEPNGTGNTYQQTFIVTKVIIPFATTLKPNGAIHWVVAPGCFTGSGQIITASYGAEGQMLGCKATSIENLSSGSEGEVSLTTQAGGWYKVFLLDANTFKPLTAASTENTELSVDVTPRGKEVFELLRSYAKDKGSLSGDNYRATVSYQNREGEIWYFTEGDSIGVFYTGNDSKNLFIPVLGILNTGEIDTELVFNQTDIGSSTSTRALFTVDAANFSGQNTPVLTEYVGAALTGLENLKFKENCRHSLTQLLILLDGFLGDRSYSIKDLGFSAFTPGNYPSQNAAFNELVAYAMSGRKNADGSYISQEPITSEFTYYVQYNPQNQSAVLGLSLSGLICETRLTIYADMRRPYEVEMEFFRYSGTARANIDPSTFTTSGGITLAPPNSSNTDWANECVDCIDMILKHTQTSPLFTVRNFMLFYSLKDLGFSAYQLQ